MTTAISTDVAQACAPPGAGSMEATVSRISVARRIQRQAMEIVRANRVLVRELGRALPGVTVARTFIGVIMIGVPFAAWWGSGRVFEGLAEHRPLEALLPGLLAMFGSLLMSGVLPPLLMGLDRIGENWVFRHVQSSIAAKAVSLDPTTLTEPTFAARFKQVKDRAVWRMMAMMRSQPMLIRALGSVVVTMTILALYDPTLTLVVAIAFMPCLIIEARHAKRQSKVDEELAPHWSLLWGDLTNLTTSVAVAMLQVFGAGGWFARRYRDRIQFAAHRENSLETGSLGVRLSAGILGGVALIATSIVLMRRAHTGSLDLGELIFLCGAVSSLGLSLAECAALVGQQFGQAYYVNALEDLLATPGQIAYPREGRAISVEGERGASLVFDEVSFSYPGGGQSKPALDRVSFALHGGAKVAAVGPNGAGKSTTMGLITRQIEPTCGSILIDGVPIAELDERTLRRTIVLLPQSLRHYNLSVRELLNLGRADAPATDGEVFAAMCRTGADRFIAKWPSGLDTQLGNDRPHAVEPSGGQLQRLLLTSVLLSTARFIILDEPVSMVDPEAAKHFWDAVFTEMPEKTVIFSTHHLGAVRRADSILFIDEGRVVAAGPHDELIQSSPRYEALFESQASEYR